MLLVLLFLFTGRGQGLDYLILHRIFGFYTLLCFLFLCIYYQLRFALEGVASMNMTVLLLMFVLAVMCLFTFVRGD